MISLRFLQSRKTVQGESIRRVSTLLYRGKPCVRAHLWPPPPAARHDTDEQPGHLSVRAVLRRIVYKGLCPFTAFCF